MISLLFALSLAARAGDARGKLEVPARDGTPLYTVWFLPEGDGPFPTVVTRVPYPMDPILAWQCRQLNEAGYACVFQHTRGQGRSGGVWEPFVHEEKDGEDLIAWIHQQSWSNQQIVWIGDSYLAATGWTVVAEDPGGISAMVSRVFAPSLYTSAYESGLMRHELMTAWMALMPDEDAGMVAGRRYHRALAHRPRMTMDEVAAGQVVPWYRAWLAGEDPASPFWTSGDPARFGAAAANTHVPVMFVGGWSDPFIDAQVEAWAVLPQRERSLFVIGPWDHLGNSPADVPLRGQDDPLAGGDGALQLPRVIAWLDANLKGVTSVTDLSGVFSYVIGGDRWEHYPTWPPPTTERRFEAAAGAGRCDGTLTEGGAPLAAPLQYRYDPEDPLPSRGGSGLLAGVVPLMNGVPPGFIRSPAHCDRREDVLQFRSAPLAAPLHLAGQIAVSLEVASDAPDTAFGFRLLEQRADGPEIILREGFVTLALRDGAPRQPYTPGERVTVLADASPLEAELHAGSELVLVLTSSSFPAFEAHPNVAGSIAEAAETRPAQQTVYRATLVLPEVVGESGSR